MGRQYQKGEATTVRDGNAHLVNKEVVVMEDSHQLGIPKQRIKVRCTCCDTIYSLSYEDLSF